MEIIFYTSNTLNSACSAVIDALGAQNSVGSRHIFISPDKFSLSIEKDIFERLGISAAFNIDVVSFMRLGAKALGPLAGDCLSKEGALLVFKKVLNRNADRLTHYAKVARMPSFASEMYAVITSFRNNCYSPDDIINASGSLSRNTKKKATDIALLYKEYIEEQNNGYPDSTSRIDKFIAEADQLELLRGADIYIAGFPSFSAKQYQIIAALMRVAKSVSVGITADNGGKNSSLYPYYTLERLKELAQLQGADFQIRESVKMLKEPFGAINRGLFSVSESQKANSGDNFILFEENTVYDEINGIAKEIVYLTACKGLRYKDIAVICCNDNYKELIRSLFTRYEIPCFVDKKYRLKDSLAAKHLLCALSTIEYGYRQDKVTAYIKNPLCGVASSDADRFENYVLERCTNYAKFLSVFEDGDEEPEAVRRKIISDLSVFQNKKQTAGDFARACKKFIRGLDATLTREAQLTQDALIKASNLQSWDKLTTILDEMETLIGNEEYDFSECKNILTSCIEGGELSLIPQYADSVFVGNIKDSLYDKLKVMFVMGATADTLPATHRYQAIISAKDSVLMEDAGLRLYPAPPDLIKEDMFALVDLFTKASDQYYFGYSKLTPNGQQTAPSPVIAELKDITGAVAVSLTARHSTLTASEDNLSLTAASPKNAFFEFLQFLPKVSQCGDKVSRNLDILYCSLPNELRKRIDSLIYAPLPQDNPSGRLYFGIDDQGRYLTKSTQLEVYFQCPYLHHLQQGLKLMPRRDGRLERNNAGIIIHRVLELFFKRTMGSLRNMHYDKLKTILNKVIEDVYSDPKIVGNSYNLFTRNALESIKKECGKLALTLAEKVKKSSYTPQLIEHSFGDNGEVVLLTSKGSFLLRGKIDRVDVRETEGCKKAIVIDYKTGSKSSPDAYFGNSLQLWMYLKALIYNGYQPAGAFYLPISDSPGKDDTPFLLTGYFDAQELDNLETGFTASCAENGKISSEVFYAKLNRKKELVYALDNTLLNEIINYNTDIAKIALEEIIHGNIEKCPQKTDRCDRCGYLLVCGGAVVENCRKVSDGRLPSVDKEGAQDD